MAENIVQNYICTRVKSVGFKTVSYLELISDNQPLSLRSRNPHNFDNFAISVTFPATLKSLLLTHAYMSDLNIVISGIGPGIGIVQDCWLRFLGIFPDAMKHPSGYHSPDMELSGFATKFALFNIL